MCVLEVNFQKQGKSFVRILAEDNDCNCVKRTPIDFGQHLLLPMPYLLRREWPAVLIGQSITCKLACA